jgi:hypothetical protein
MFVNNSNPFDRISRYSLSLSLLSIEISFKFDSSQQIVSHLMNFSWLFCCKGSRNKKRICCWSVWNSCSFMSWKRKHPHLFSNHLFQIQHFNDEKNNSSFVSYREIFMNSINVNLNYDICMNWEFEAMFWNSLHIAFSIYFGSKMRLVGLFVFCLISCTESKKAEFRVLELTKVLKELPKSVRQHIWIKHALKVRTYHSDFETKTHLFH